MCGGGECRVKELGGKKAVLMPGFFSRAAEERAIARDEKVDAQTGLGKASDEKETEKTTLLNSRRTRSTESRCWAGSRALANKCR